MMVFDAYARYYDLLYRDKDYAAESKYVHSILAEHAPQAESILELGCGTGRHARHLAEAGYKIAGIDASDGMLAAADSMRAALPAATAERLVFGPGDARTYRTEQQFGAVITLFHVASYQTSNADVSALLQTAAAQCEPGGIFVFDCWYGPAVLTERPETRIKRLEDEEIAITRLAEPNLDTEANRVDVHYEVHIRHKASGAVQVIEETHQMRYFFLPELHALLSACGFTPILAEEWLTRAKPSAATWGLCMAARKNA